MKSQTSGVIIIILAVVAAIVSYATFFSVQQTQYALLLRFGEPRGEIRDPGLHAKMPFVENVLYIDKRILDLRANDLEVNTTDKQRIVVDWFARYHIIEPLKFYQNVQTIPSAEQQLSAITGAAVRRIIAQASFVDIVRNRRAELMGKIRDEINLEAVKMGIKVVDLRIRRADLPAANSANIYDQMNKKLQQIATGIRAQGTKLGVVIKAEADRTVAKTLGEANRQAEEIRGAADAERTKIFAEAYGKDPEFFAFYRSMQAYSEALKDQTRFVMNPDSDFFRYMRSPSSNPEKRQNITPQGSEALQKATPLTTPAQ